LAPSDGLPGCFGERVLVAPDEKTDGRNWFHLTSNTPGFYTFVFQEFPNKHWDYSMRNLQRIIQCFKNFLSRVWITPFFSARHIWMLKTIPVMAPRLLIYNERYSCKWWLSLKLDSFFFLLRRAAPCSQTHVPVTGCGLDDVWKFETLSWASFVFRLTSNSAAKRTVLGAVLSFLFDRHMGVWLLLSHVIIHGIKK
jgi:hypothetical protein